METLEWNSDMMISAVVLAVTFIAIFTEEIQGTSGEVCHGGRGWHDRSWPIPGVLQP